MASSTKRDCLGCQCLFCRRNRRRTWRNVLPSRWTQADSWGAVEGAIFGGEARKGVVTDAD